MLIRLDDGCYVAADQITEVKLNTYATHITVRTKDGIGHSVPGNYDTLTKLVEQIDNAMEKP